MPVACKTVQGAGGRLAAESCWMSATLSPFGCETWVPSAKGTQLPWVVGTPYSRTSGVRQKKMTADERRKQREACYGSRVTRRHHVVAQKKEKSSRFCDRGGVGAVLGPLEGQVRRLGPSGCTAFTRGGTVRELGGAAPPSLGRH